MSSLEMHDLPQGGYQKNSEPSADHASAYADAHANDDDDTSYHG